MIVKLLDDLCWLFHFPFLIGAALCCKAVEVLQPELKFKLKTHKEWVQAGLDPKRDD